MARAGLLLMAATISSPAAAPLDVMPRPAEIRQNAGRMALGAELVISLTGHDDARLRATVERAAARLQQRVGIRCTIVAGGAERAQVQIECRGPAREIPQLGDDESYAFEITPERVVLRAPSPLGVLRGWETLLQVLHHDAGGWSWPAVAVRDEPRFPWRGLLVDVVRHWQPTEVIRRTLDGMALVKLNVLHLHLTDDQGFRIESLTHPELHTRASDGQFFTQAEMRGLIRYAAERGIRVVPEFDVPGHATSWLVSHPELGSAPGPYEPCRRWGVLHAVLDPTNEALYPLLEDFLGEMAALFPDPFLHIGGDENDGVHWNANPRIQQFIRERDLRDNAGLHAWFNGRLAGILQRHGKRLVGWDEVLHPDLPRDSVVHSWRGPTGVVQAARAGHAVILSHGYYIDLNHPAADHYANDPLPADSPLTAEERQLVLGGEATMWSEWVTPDNIDTRIWPRTAAIAERLWSPREVNDPAEMYRRLPIVEERLRELGLLAGWPRVELPGIDPSGSVAAALLELAAVVEPVKVYRRGRLQPDIGQLQPLNELADWARPESRPAREFAAAVEAWLFADGPLAPAEGARLAEQFAAWESVGARAAAAPADGSPRAQGRGRVARSLTALSRLGREAVAALLAGEPATAEWCETARQALAEARPNAAAVEFPFLPAWQRLVAAAERPEERARMPREEWRRSLSIAEAGK